MLEKELEKEFNNQVKYEAESAHYYLAIANYFKSEDLDGFAHFFEVQAQEERFHAQKFVNFIDEMGGRVKLQALEQPKNEFESIVEVFEYALNHEKFISKRINKLMDLSQENSNYAAISFLNWFVDEQVEEEATMDAILNKVKRVAKDNSGIFMLDNELSQRTFTPPVE